MIDYFKILRSKVVCTILKIFWIIPVKKKQVLFMSYDGMTFSDSPMYIYRKMKDMEIRFIWAIKKGVITDELKLLPKNTKVINRYSLAFLYYILTSKVIVVNDTLNVYLPIRKNQVLINTWHGGGAFKTVGMTEKNPSKYDEFFFKEQAKKTSIFIACSESFIRDVIHDSFLYYGEVLRTGIPRNAILFQKHGNIKEKVHDYYSISLETKIVLYAPTFRKNNCFIVNEKQLDMSMCTKALRRKFKNNFVLLYRAHHLLSYTESKDTNGFLDATDYPDMQELLCAADVLISDYSSCLWDATLLKIPVFLFVPDVDDYSDDRGFLLDIHEWPYSLARTNEELNDNIIAFDYEDYKQSAENFLVKLGSYESENAVIKAVSFINDLL